VTRFDLEMIAPWLQDSTDVLQVGVLGPDDDPSMVDPYARHIRGRVEQDGDRFYLNTMGRSFLASERLYLKCLKRAYDHCRVAGGVWGGRQGLDAESDEAPCERDWVTSSGLVIAWRRYAHMLEPMANQRLIRDQAMAAAWFSDRCREHFSAPLPARTLKERRHFGPPSLAGTG
jgi:hypothetical protein